MDFTDGEDRLSFFGYGPGLDTPAALIVAAKQRRADTVIVLVADTEVVLVNFGLGDLDTGDFA